MRLRFGWSCRAALCCQGPVGDCLYVKGELVASLNRLGFDECPS